MKHDGTCRGCAVHCVVGVTGGGTLDIQHGLGGTLAECRIRLNLSENVRIDTIRVLRNETYVVVKP